ncbi:hypothetical protein Pan216_12110 [Planctomycetes bacterium Pan216]|uniref:Uncharacterized protein n=1 Tax=Kolteria novifilia TaxID=2527975 RepID=A0A518B0B5_9BACT|nr:hypothetical protein Pan216_12110 [Planctomycetes bacterium Pan216]
MAPKKGRCARVTQDATNDIKGVFVEEYPEYWHGDFGWRLFKSMS